MLYNYFQNIELITFNIYFDRKFILQALNSKIFYIELMLEMWGQDSFKMILLRNLNLNWKEKKISQILKRTFGIISATFSHLSP